MHLPTTPDVSMTLNPCRCILGAVSRIHVFKDRVIPWPSMVVRVYPPRSSVGSVRWLIDLQVLSSCALVVLPDSWHWWHWLPRYQAFGEFILFNDWMPICWVSIYLHLHQNQLLSIHSVPFGRHKRTTSLTISLVASRFMHHCLCCAILLMCTSSSARA